MTRNKNKKNKNSIPKTIPENSIVNDDESKDESKDELKSKEVRTVPVETVFLALKAFVSDSCNLLPENKNIQLYNRLLFKTTISHTGSIVKHVDIVKQFVTENAQAIVTTDASALADELKYNTKIFIPIKELMEAAKPVEKEALWTHLLLISAYVDPPSNAKTVLENMKTSHIPVVVESTDVQESVDHIMKNLQDTIGNTMSNESFDTNEMFANVMNSGVLDEVMSMIGSRVDQDNLDIDDLMSTATRMLQNMGSDTEKQDSQKILSALGMSESDLSSIVSKINSV